MDEPPFIIDGARVLCYAGLPPAGGTTAVASGVPLASPAAIIIAENLADGATFLLFCNEDWETLSAEPYPDREAAERAASAAFPGIAARWQSYRALTPGERAEIETTRTFLRDLARDFPNEP